MTTPVTKALKRWSDSTPEEQQEAMTSLAQHQDPRRGVTFTYEWVELRRNTKRELVLTVRVGIQPGEDIGSLLYSVLGHPAQWVSSEGGLERKARPAQRAVIATHGTITDSQAEALAAALTGGVEGVAPEDVLSTLRVRLIPTEEVQLAKGHIRAWMEHAINDEAKDLDSVFGTPRLAQRILDHPYSGQWARQQAAAYLAR